MTNNNESLPLIIGNSKSVNKKLQEKKKHRDIDIYSRSSYFITIRSDRKVSLKLCKISLVTLLIS